jgi:xanthine dehydrogenase YagS FAD-binding subunit
MNNFNYSKAHTVQEAVEQVSASDQTQFVAGGTNILDLWNTIWSTLMRLLM